MTMIDDNQAAAMTVRNKARDKAAGELQEAAAASSAPHELGKDGVRIGEIKSTGASPVRAEVEGLCAATAGPTEVEA